MTAVATIEYTPRRLFRIREMLGRNGRPLARAKFAALIGTTEGTIFRWETGKLAPREMSQRAIDAWVLANLTKAQMAELERIQDTSPAPL
jgi:hypothetical protein